MKKFRFLEWKVYKDSQDLLRNVLKIVEGVPKKYRFELGSQLIRSAMSVGLNIAEGSGKSSDKDMNRFFDIALGSLYETVAGMDSLRYNKLISDEDFKLIKNLSSDIADQLGGFKKKLK